MEDRDSVFVPKDLSKIKTKFLFGLTRRQCLFSRAGRGGRSAGVFSAQKERQLNRRVDADDGRDAAVFHVRYLRKNGQPLETVLRQMVETEVAQTPAQTV